MYILLKIYQKLLKNYGYQGWWPIQNIGYHKKDYSYPKTDLQRFEIFCGAILTQNTSWTNVEKSLQNLIKNDMLNPKKILEIDIELLKQNIKTSGYFNQKAKKLKIIAEFFLWLDGRIPKRQELLDLWGIGPETADSILLYAYNQPEFVVDAYTKRMLIEYDLIQKTANYEYIKNLFESSLPKDYKMFQEYHALIVEYGKNQRRKIVDN